MPEDRPGFDFNRPTIVGLLYLFSVFNGVTLLIGLVLAYMWKDDERTEAWEVSHYRYFIRTFWLGLLYGVIGAVTAILLVGFLIMALVGVWIAIRAVMSLMAAQRRAPIVNVETWLW